MSYVDDLTERWHGDLDSWPVPLGVARSALRDAYRAMEIAADAVRAVEGRLPRWWHLDESVDDALRSVGSALEDLEDGPGPRPEPLPEPLASLMRRRMEQEMEHGSAVMRLWRGSAVFRARRVPSDDPDTVRMCFDYVDADGVRRESKG